jgi:tRNA modification GTPase
LMDTIYALATALGKAGIAVMRLSGQLALTSAEGLVGPLPSHGRALRQVRDETGQVLDEALILTFENGRSFTGEVVVELHLHGSQAVVAAVIGVLGRCDGLRMAEPGEFTRRAFENGRLDLSQVEGLADLIDAETEGQRRQAQRILSGALAAKAEAWRGDLIRSAALVEATIDFADEDVPVDVWPEVAALMAGVAGELRAEAAGVRMAERVRDGFEVAIVGAPNVGKSTLLNRLAQREAAITSEIAGTTRDVIEVRLDLDGLAVTLLDTAGLRDAVDQIEQIGIARAIARADAADLRIHLVLPGLAPELEVRRDDIVVLAKADLNVLGRSDDVVLAVSGLTGAGGDALIERVSEVLRARVAGIGVAVRERHRVAMIRAVGHLGSAIVQSGGSAVQVEMVADELRSAIRALDALVGRVDVEDILGEIFASFCIGK